MRTTTNLSVKGPRYYKAAELLQKGSLLSSTAIRLEHQPHNPHDKNAVAVRVKRTGAMLGHISREVAAKYVELLNSGKVIEASVRVGANYFEAKVLARGVSPANLPTVEADRISSLLNAGSALYNLTADGQGTGRNFRGQSKSEPISDQLARQRAEAERRRIDEIFAKKKEKIFDIFEPTLAALLPKTSFWTYFAATFVSALIMLAVLIQNIKDGSLFILSAVLAFLVSPFMNGHFREKAKQTVQYQNLVKQRDEQLAVLDNERNKPHYFD